MIFRDDFLTAGSPSFLSKVDGVLLGWLFAPVAFGLAWYDMLNVTAAPVMGA